jgi:hypothetical protein
MEKPTISLDPKKPRVFSPPNESLVFEKPKASVDLTFSVSFITIPGAVRWG